MYVNQLYKKVSLIAASFAVLFDASFPFHLPFQYFSYNDTYVFFIFVKTLFHIVLRYFEGDRRSKNLSIGKKVVTLQKIKNLFLAGFT